MKQPIEVNDIAKFLPPSTNFHIVLIELGTTASGVGSMQRLGDGKG